MHHIQKKILEHLTLVNTCRYSDMRPPKVESNQFAYHLKKLIKEGYIHKAGRDYSLSPVGLAYVDKISYSNFTQRTQPRVATMLDITNSKGETIMYRRNHQPLFGKIVYPNGKLHMGEDVATSAKRELYEKVLIKNVDLKLRGIVSIKISTKGVLISHSLNHVFSGITDQSLPNRGEGWSERFWAKHADCDDIDFAPGYLDIKKLLKREDFFFEELSFEV